MTNKIKINCKYNDNFTVNLNNELFEKFAVYRERWNLPNSNLLLEYIILANYCSSENDYKKIVKTFKKSNLSYLRLKRKRNIKYNLSLNYNNIYNNQKNTINLNILKILKKGITVNLDSKYNNTYNIIAQLNCDINYQNLLTENDHSYKISHIFKSNIYTI